MRGIRCRLSADAPWTLCVTAGWSQRVNWEEVDKREGGVNKELGFGRFSIDLHPHQFLKGHQQYSTDKKSSAKVRFLVIMELFQFTLLSPFPLFCPWIILHNWVTMKASLTAGDGAIVLRELVEEQHFLLSQLQTLLLDQVHLLLGFEGLLGHHKVLLQHALLLLPPLSPRVLNLGSLWQEDKKITKIYPEKTMCYLDIGVCVHIFFIWPFFTRLEPTEDALTVNVVDVVNSHLLVVNLLPPKRQFISDTVGKRQWFGDPKNYDNLFSGAAKITHYGVLTVLLICNTLVRRCYFTHFSASLRNYTYNNYVK